MTDRSKFTKEFLNECFQYKDGNLIWKIRPVHHFKDEWRQKIFNKRQSGDSAGTICSGYIMINFNGLKISAHRAIFMMHHGFFPYEVDHIDGNPLNNNIENLRATTHAQNMKNMKMPTRNTSGVKGVYFHKTNNRWTAGIRAEGKWKHLGSFMSIVEATTARILAEKSHYGEFSNGR